MFYFQQLLSQGLSGIDGTSMISTITTISYTILLVGFMVGLYQAAMRGGDVQSLGVAAIKYAIVAIILANWSTVFRDINNSCNQLAQFISSTSSAGDVFSTWLSQLQQQFQNTTLGNFLNLITGTAAAVITALLIIAAYVIFVVAVVIFGFFYTLYGCVLYVVGPLVLALIPIVGVGRLGANYATNLLIWNSWGILYAIFSALITAIHTNDINTILNGNGFLGFMSGAANSVVLGIVSIFYAVALLLIPKIAKSVISGDVGVTMTSLVRAGATAAATVMSIASGSGAGAASAESASGSGTGAGAGGGLGAGSSAGGSLGDGAASSSTPPPEPSLAGTMRSGIASAVSSESPTSSGGSSDDFSVPVAASGGRESAVSTGNGGNSQHQPFNRNSVLQSAAFHTARVASQVVHRALGSENGNREANGGES